MDDGKDINPNLDDMFDEFNARRKRKLLLETDVSDVEYAANRESEESDGENVSAETPNSLDNRLEKNFGSLVYAHKRRVLLSRKDVVRFNPMPSEEAKKTLKKIVDGANFQVIGKILKRRNFLVAASIVIIVGFLLLVASEYFMSEESTIAEDTVRVEEAVVSPEAPENTFVATDSASKQTEFVASEYVFPKYFVKEREVFGYVDFTEDTVFVDFEFISDRAIQTMDYYEWTRTGDAVSSKKFLYDLNGDTAFYRYRISHGFEKNSIMVETHFEESDVNISPAEEQALVDSLIKDLIGFEQDLTEELGK